MFSLHCLEVVNWDYWDRFTVPMDAPFITLVGPNGSGKTTFLDALRTLLGIECSKDRDYKRYTRHSKAPEAWIRGVVTNPMSTSKEHAFFPIMTPLVTLACRIRRAGGVWERKYAIQVDDVSIEELDRPDQVWLGVRDFDQRLRNAGLTPALKKVLALNQGQTDRLADYTPPQLLKLVFDTFGDQDVLDQYAGAKGDYEQAQREFDETERQLNLLKALVTKLQIEAEYYLEWKSRRDHAFDVQAFVLPLLRLREAHELRSEVLRERGQLGARMRENLRSRADKRSLLDAKNQDLAALAQRRVEAGKASEQARSEFSDLREQIGRLGQVLADRDSLIRVCSAQREGVNHEAVQRELADVSAESGRVSHQLKDHQKRLSELRHELEELEGAKRRPWPEPDRFLSRLTSKGIAAVLVADILDVTDPRWQLAVEGVLGGARATVLLDKPSDTIAAYHLALEHRYRFHVTERRVPARQGRSGSLLGVVRCTAPAPAWLFAQLDHVLRVESIEEGYALNRRNPDAQWVTPEAYYRDARGGRYAGHVDRYLGAAGRDSARLELLAEQHAIETDIESARDRGQTLARRLSELQALLNGFDAERQLAARAEEFAFAQQDHAVLTKRAAELALIVAETGEKERLAVEALAKLNSERTQHVKELEGIDRELTERRGQLQGAASRSSSHRQAYRAHLLGAPVTWAQVAFRDAALEERGYGDSTASAVMREVERELDWVQEHAESKDENVVARHAYQKGEMIRHETLLDERRTTRDTTLTLVDKQREHYINVLRASAAVYLSNVRALAALAGADVEAELPHIGNDDVSLARAGLEPIFRFDEKAAADREPGDSSGGQRVIKSLVLLVALMMDEERPQGIVIVDEPFAHLDILNIDRVSAFLARTRAQYLLTSPVTHNTNIYRGTRITLTSQKVRPGERIAPPICVAVRRQTHE